VYGKTLILAVVIKLSALLCNFSEMQARSQKCEIGERGQVMKVEGQQVERRRRKNLGALCAEDQGAKGAKGSGVWGGGVSLPNGGEIWGGGCPSPEIFSIFCLGMLHFGCNLMHFQT